MLIVLNKFWLIGRFISFTDSVLVMQFKKILPYIGLAAGITIFTIQMQKLPQQLFDVPTTDPYPNHSIVEQYDHTTRELYRLQPIVKDAGRLEQKMFKKIPGVNPALEPTRDLLYKEQVERHGIALDTSLYYSSLCDSLERDKSAIEDTSTIYQAHKNYSEWNAFSNIIVGGSGLFLFGASVVVIGKPLGLHLRNSFFRYMNST